MLMLSGQPIFQVQPSIQCAFRSLFASPSRQSKPMNFGADGIHRMFRLTQHSPREDVGCTIDFRFRCEQPGLCSPAKGDPHEWAPEFTS